MRKYRILLPNDKADKYRYLAFFILSFNLFIFGLIYFTTAGSLQKNLSLTGTLISVVSLVAVTPNAYNRKKKVFGFLSSFLALGIIWLVMGKYFVAICILTFGVVGFFTTRKLWVLFTPDNILYPSFPKKMILWKEVSNVILKDNMLTIDLKNNRLFQSVITKESADLTNEYSFNEFCKKQIGN